MPFEQSKVLKCRPWLVHKEKSRRPLMNTEMVFPIVNHGSLSEY